MDRIWAATDFAIVDIETTDFIPKYARPCEIAGVTVRRGTIDASNVYHTHINPEKTISRKCVEFHKITRDMVRHAPTFAQQDTAFRNFLKNKIVVIHSGAGYDIHILQRRMKDYVFQTVLDTCNLARALDSTSPDHKLSTLVERYRLSERVERRLGARESCPIPSKALYDAFATAYLLIYLVRYRIGERCTLREILGMF